jgi:hypothetical protein
VIALPVIILVGLLGGLVFSSVRNANDAADLAYRQQHQQQQQTTPAAPKQP